MNDIAIKVEGVSKVFRLPHEKQNSVKGALISMVRGGKRTFEKQQVLKDISFEIKKGEFFGIVGRNGSGKSTLLKMLAGIYSPTEGTIHVNGKLTPFIELGVGFNPELTGRENVFLNGALLGFNRKEMTAMYDDIVAFAEIEKFMDQKLKNYSSGMQVRLAFSIAIRAETEILLIDEVLAVGDIIFQEKCFKVFKDIKKSGKTVVLVSHDLNSLQEFCDRIAIVDKGRLVGVGEATDMVMKYETLVAETSVKVSKLPIEQGNRPGSGDYYIEKVEILNEQHKIVNNTKLNEPFTVRVHYTAKKKVSEFVCGISITDQDGVSLIGPNTKQSEFKLVGLNPKGRGYVDARFDNNLLNSGEYYVTVGLFNDIISKPYDFYTNATSFKVIGGTKNGRFNIEPKWSNHKATN